MTAKNFIDLVLEVLSQTTKDDRLHEEVVRQACGRAYNQMLGELMSKGYKNLSPYTKLYKGVSVVKDNDTNIYYSVLPTDISPLVDVKSGVRSISSMTDSSYSFVPIDREKIPVIGNNLVSKVSRKIGYTIGTNNLGQLTVDYFNMVTNPGTVKMYLVRPFEDYDDNEDIHIPAGQDQNVLTVVLKILQGRPEKDFKISNSEMK